MRAKVSEPTNGSVMILNASAENGFVVRALALELGALSGSVPLTAATSIGDGRKSTTASSSGCTPLFLNAAPHSTGRTCC
jgi:hypothetical protein